MVRGQEEPMFLRTVKAAGGQGVQHEYVRLVEAYREDGRAKQRVVCNLGRKDLLAAHLDALIRLLRGEPVRRAAVRLGEEQAPCAGAGGQSAVRADERAWPGPLVGDGFRLRPPGAALEAGVAGRRRTAGESAAARARRAAPTQAVVSDPRSAGRAQAAHRAGTLSAAARSLFAQGRPRGYRSRSGEPSYRGDAVREGLRPAVCRQASEPAG